MKINWFGHAGFMIESTDKVIYIDPYIIPKNPDKADIILVTHDHYDHCDINNIRKLRKMHTVILASAEAAKKLGEGAAIARPGDIIHVGEVDIRVVHAYNTDKYFHKKHEGLGFIIESENKRIYHSGDTDVIPEMKTLGKIDVALMAVGGKYTMTAEEAADAIHVIKPELAVPMHWGKVVGSEEDAEIFKEIVEDETETKVVIMEGEALEI